VPPHFARRNNLESVFHTSDFSNAASGPFRPLLIELFIRFVYDLAMVLSDGLRKEDNHKGPKTADSKKGESFENKGNHTDSH